MTKKWLVFSFLCSLLLVYGVPKLFKVLRSPPAQVVVFPVTEQRGFKVESPRLAGRNRLHKIFSSLILADWAAYHTACLYGADPEQIPMVEDFKKRIG